MIVMRILYIAPTTWLPVWPETRNNDLRSHGFGHRQAAGFVRSIAHMVRLFCGDPFGIKTFESTHVDPCAISSALADDFGDPCGLGFGSMLSASGACAGVPDAMLIPYKLVEFM
jgi:hypothetical protein